MKSFFKKIGHVFLDFIQTTVVALSIFVIAYLFLVQPHQVKGSSMIPNFIDQEYILTDKISYRFHEPQREDVIIFTAPNNPEYEYIKRIIGLPGERIKIERGVIFINNEQLTEDYLPDSFQTLSGRFLKEGQTYSIPDNQYFVIGDNRNHSSDSREWGSVPRSNIIGRAWFRYWPLTEVGLVNK